MAWENQFQMKTYKKKHPTHKQMRRHIPRGLPVGRACRRGCRQRALGTYVQKQYGVSANSSVTDGKADAREAFREGVDDRAWKSWAQSCPASGRHGDNLCIRRCDRSPLLKRLQVPSPSLCEG